MENTSPEEEKLIKCTKNHLRQKKLNYTSIKDVRNLFRLQKENKAIKVRVLMIIRNLFEHEKEEKSYYKPVKSW